MVPPAVTLERVGPLMRGMGITRIANVTGLDVVGIPVAQAARPNARSNAVSQGKGLDLDSAKASALMEAIETYHAEQGCHPVHFASTAELRRHARTAEVTRLPMASGTKYHADLDMLWIEGEDLINGEAVWVPYECVHTRFKQPYPPGSGCFPTTTNGLASGNNRVEAIVHGLCEAIERDATSLFELEPRRRTTDRVALGSIDDPDCRWLIDRFECAGLIVAVWDITSDIGIPTFWCQVMERDDGPALLPHPAEGHGCHLDKSVALARALTEAAQARVTVIAGARDDMSSDRYRASDDVSQLSAWKRFICTEQGPRQFGAMDSFGTPAFEMDLRLLLDRLKARGIDEAIVVDLTAEPDAPYAVVRIVVPGLEGIVSGGCRPGDRARRTVSR
ncbi:MAG: YcaO-like family protein [Dongiaceae bacterium]